MTPQQQSKKTNQCDFRGCKVKLKEEYDKWMITTSGHTKIYCEKHYNKIERRLKLES